MEDADKTFPAVERAMINKDSVVNTKDQATLVSPSPQFIDLTFLSGMMIGGIELVD